MRTIISAFVFIFILAGVSCKMKKTENTELKKTAKISSDSSEVPESKFVEPPPVKNTAGYATFKKWLASIDSIPNAKLAETVYHFKLFTINSKPAIYVLKSDNVQIEKSKKVTPVGDSYILKSDDFTEGNNGDLLSSISKELIQLSKSDSSFLKSVNQITVGFNEKDMIVVALHK